MKKDCKKWAKYIPLFIILFVVAVIAFSYIVMSLWNWLIPELFGGPVITMLQAIGLLILAKILFGSFNHGHHKPSEHTRSHIEWRKKFYEKFKERAPHSDEVENVATE